MREHKIVVMGSMGCGKSTLVRAIAAGAVINTDVHNSDRQGADKASTTVAMDYADIDLPNGDRLRLYGTPGQQRFDFLWPILLQGASGVVLLLDATRDTVADELAAYLAVLRQHAAQAPLLLGLSLLIVFLCLAALYESWSIPTSVLLVVPLGVLGAVLAVSLRGMPNDVFFKVGLITIIGLSAKNAILIIEFAKDLYEQGEDLIDATLKAARLRLRPIIMTSLAFILGVVPLAIATGASSASQQAIGTGVIGGMITATLAVVFVPVFFVVVMKLVRKRR